PLTRSLAELRKALLQIDPGYLRGGTLQPPGKRARKGTQTLQRPEREQGEHAKQCDNQLGFQNKVRGVSSSVGICGDQKRLVTRQCGYISTGPAANDNATSRSRSDWPA